MTTLSAPQIASVAAQAGFRGDGLTWAVAVALAESGGRTDAVRTNADKWHSRDRGLWQINDHWHPEVSDAAAFNPTSCAAAANRISKGGSDWSAWSTWSDGAAYAQYGRATMAVAQLGQGAATGTPSGVQNAGFNFGGALGELGQGPLGMLGGGLGLLPGGNPLSDLGSAITAPVDALKAIVEFMSSTAEWVSNPHNWLRVAYVVGGSAGVIIFLSMLAKSGAMGEGASEVASVPMKIAENTPVGSALKGAAGGGKTKPKNDEPKSDEDTGE